MLIICAVVGRNPGYIAMQIGWQLYLDKLVDLGESGMCCLLFVNSVSEIMFKVCIDFCLTDVRG